MRVCIIGHAYVAEDNRVKWKSLAQTGEVDLELHLPHQWPSWEKCYRPNPVRTDRFEIKVGHALRTGREDQYIFVPKIFRGLKGGDFNVLHVEQGSASFIYSQALLERNLFSRKTKSCFFTWINWEPPLRWPWTSAEVYNLKHSDGAICGNSEAVDILRRHGYRGKATVIPQLGVDPEEYSPKANDELRSKLGLKGVVIGFVGRLVEEKGLKILKAALENIKTEFTALILGSGPLEMEWNAETRFKNGKVVRVPPVSHEEVVNYIRAMDMLVLPSYSTPTWKEQFGHVLIEAMGCEVPVIGSTSAAIPEVIGEAGLLFKEHSVDELQKCLVQLADSFSERKRFGTLGRKRVLEKFTHANVAKQTLEFWKTL